MSPPYSTAGLLSAAALTTLTLIGGAGATVVTTCRAAADGDARVDYGSCVAELGKHRDSPDADAWGLAKVAALTGVVNADDAVYDIKAALAAKQAGGGGDAQARAALERCRELYESMGFAFAEADDEINARDYAAGKGKAAEAVALAHQCDDALAKAAGAVPSPMAKRSAYAVQIANICTAITNLIN
ncbi:hypothetical protein PR202_gb08695 [Eleusine coracana subsp. coracana]|uniref:Pectinesterase inhibitor domain-containing protein n=1 Tax=Eleusine coracana subsp. coracana TaxID=191504 RepID=A0AAV5EDP9_ELECO|nr:hypothetical protein QOZ80_2BG0188460 [Eleusine coracana subsp. coracana]GJN21234.1 hypothetical protein PR202_gb08695 [Eleusine coracana subsp. coracana]